MSEITSRTSNIYYVLGWISFILGILITPLFSALGIVMGIISNNENKKSGTVVIWANSILLAVGLIVTIFIYGIAGLAFFTIIKALLGY